MEILKRKEKNVLVISLKGRLDAVTTPMVQKDLMEVVAGEERLLVLDLGEVDYVSSTGLRTILAVTKSLKAKEGSLLLASLKGVVREVFEISGFSSFIPIFESVDAAISSAG